MGDANRILRSYSSRGKSQFGMLVRARQSRVRIPIRIALRCSVIALAVAIACGGPPPPPPGGLPEIVPGGALFRYRNPDAKKVFLVGDFNDWSATADPMTDDNGDGEWTLFYPLSSGVYAYKFVVDGKNWVADPANPLSEPDGFNGRNSIVKIAGQAQ